MSITPITHIFPKNKTTALDKASKTPLNHINSKLNQRQPQHSDFIVKLNIVSTYADNRISAPFVIGQLFLSDCVFNCQS